MTKEISSPAPVPENKWKSGLIGGLTGAIGATIVGLIFSSTTLTFISNFFEDKSLPPNAVVFVSAGDCGQVGDGWKKFDLAAGRFLVGAGSNSDYPARRFEPNITSRGNAELRLNENNLPSISVQIPYWEFGIGVGGAGTLPTANRIAEGSGFPGSSQKTARVIAGGKADPVDILPPSIALTACQKS